MTAPSWYPDPTGRHEVRYYDGAAWTENVSDQGVQSVDAPTLGAPGTVPMVMPAIAPAGVAYVVAPPQQTNAFAVTALVAGVAGALCGLIPILSIPALIGGVLGLLFGILGRNRVKKLGATGNGLATAGLILGAIAIALGIIGFVIVQNAVDKLKTDTNSMGAVVRVVD